MTTDRGFIGLGVMGAPMCRNLAARGGRVVRAFDRAGVPDFPNVIAVGSVAALLALCDTIHLCLPSGAHVQSVCDEMFARPLDGLRMVVDHGTSPVAMTRALAQRFGEAGVTFVDAPIARTRQAAEDGTLSIMVGADVAVFEALAASLRCMASDLTLCGPVGCGQAVKILNNMVLVETVAALSEALAIGRTAGVAPEVLFAALAKGSADSFALRNHGMKAMLPGVFPEREVYQPLDAVSHPTNCMNHSKFSTGVTGATYRVCDSRRQFDALT